MHSQAVYLGFQFHQILQLQILKIANFVVEITFLYKKDILF